MELLQAEQKATEDVAETGGAQSPPQAGEGSHPTGGRKGKDELSSSFRMKCGLPGTLILAQATDSGLSDLGENRPLSL